MSTLVAALFPRNCVFVVCPPPTRNSAYGGGRKLPCLCVWCSRQVFIHASTYRFAIRESRATRRRIAVVCDSCALLFQFPEHYPETEIGGPR
jgi:hypothetical protein